MVSISSTSGIHPVELPTSPVQTPTNSSAQPLPVAFPAPSAGSAVPPRPDAPPARPRASSTQLARFSAIDNESSPSKPVSRNFQGAWKNAHNDIVSEVASHLTLPDRLALSQSSVALRNAMLEHNDIKAPLPVAKAWTALQSAKNVKALDTLLNYLPSAGPLDKPAIAMEFVKHNLNFESEHLQKLDHLYDALPSVSAADPGATIKLIHGLFDYGIGRLPPKKYCAGLEQITSSLHAMAANRDPLNTFNDLAEKRYKVKALSDLITIAINRLTAMPLTGDEKESIGKKIIETINLNQAGSLLHDFSLNSKDPSFKLSNAYAESALQAMSKFQNTPVKLDLANELVTHFDRLELEDAPRFLSELNALLHPLPDQGVDRETTNRLLTSLKNFQQQNAAKP
jgi:hypothetical protein